MLITSQTGAVRVVKNGALLSAAALDLSSSICTNSERGVLGVAVDPDWISNHHVFLYYTFKRGNCNTNDPTNGPRNRVSRFTYNVDTDKLSGESVIVDNLLSLGGNHNGGDIHFGADGLLYISVGDSGCQLNNSSACGGGNTNAKNKNLASGKILRVKRDGSIPSDNPWVGSPGARRCTQPGTDPMYALASDKPCSETYAWGLRNPFRFAFDPTGAFFNIDDVGQNISEEIDRGAKGANYGWPTREGYCANGQSCTGPGTPPAGMTDPIFAWDRNASGVTNGCKSITGGAFVPGGVFGSAYDGSYLFSDYVCGKIFKLTSSGSVSVFGSALGGSSAVAMTFGPDPSGGGTSLYYTSYASGGEIHRIAFTGAANRAPIARVSASPASGPAPLQVSFDGSASSDPDSADHVASYRWDFGDGSAAVTTTAPTTTHGYAAGDFTARLTVVDTHGLASAAATVAISSGNTPPTISITSPSPSKLFTVGEHLTLTAAASDAEDGMLSGASISWNVLRHHADHTHPWFSGTGTTVVIDGAAPEDLAAAQNSYLEIQVTATDSDGLSTTVTQDLNPKKVNLTFASSPVGMRLELDTTTIIQAPETVVSWQGWGLRVNAPAQAGQVWASWSDGGAADHVFTTPATATTVTASFVTGTPGFAAKVSFRPAASPVPAGYVADSGAPYGARGNGLTYGWNGDDSAATRDRNSAASPDELHDALIHMQKPELPDAVWEMAVPNGSYDVHLVSGDAGYTDSVFRVNVEGIPVVSGTPTAANHWVEGTAVVTVNDGKLTVSNGSGASNNKLNFVELTKRP